MILLQFFEGAKVEFYLNYLPLFLIIVPFGNKAPSLSVIEHLNIQNEADYRVGKDS